MSTDAPSLPYITEALRPLAVPLESIRPMPGNARTHPEKNRGIIRGSLSRFLQVKPIVLASDGVTIIAGNGTFAQAVQLGWTHIAVVRSHLSGAEATAYSVADNKAGDEAGWADDLLESALRDLTPDLRAATGFDDRELHEMFGEQTSSLDDQDVPPKPRVAVTKPGDVWHLGPHRLICRSSADAMTPPLLLRAAGCPQWDHVFTDPPYGVEYVGKTKDALKIKNDGADTLRALLYGSLRPAREYCAPGGAWYVCATHGPQFLDFAQVLTDLGIWRQTILWVKDAFVMGRSDFHYQHEAIFHGAAPAAPAGCGLPPVEAPGESVPAEPAVADPQYVEGAEGAATSIIYGWVPGASHTAPPGRDYSTTWFIKRPKANREHPTMKPVSLVVKALTLSTQRGQRIYDPFLGSGTTLLACEETGRVCLGCELEPAYCDVIARRWQDLTGGVARRYSSAGVEMPGLGPVAAPAGEETSSAPDLRKVEIPDPRAL